MRVVLDYGGVIVEHADEREYAHLLGVPPDEDPYPGWLAYYLFRAGFLDGEAGYVDLLSTLRARARRPASSTSSGPGSTRGSPTSTETSS